MCEHVRVCNILMLYVSTHFTRCTFGFIQLPGTEHLARSERLYNLVSVWRSLMQAKSRQGMSRVSSSGTHQSMIRYLVTIRDALAMITRAYVVTRWYEYVCRVCTCDHTYIQYNARLNTLPWIARTNVCAPMFTGFYLMYIWTLNFQQVD